jgi:hypothetical protein
LRHPSFKGIPPEKDPFDQWWNGPRHRLRTIPAEIDNAVMMLTLEEHRKDRAMGRRANEPVTSGQERASTWGRRRRSKGRFEGAPPELRASAETSFDQTVMTAEEWASKPGTSGNTAELDLVLHRS